MGKELCQHACRPEGIGFPSSYTAASRDHDWIPEGVDEIDSSLPGSQSVRCLQLFSARLRDEIVNPHDLRIEAEVASLEEDYCPQ